MATRAPDETDILCESCGYMLNGLPPDGRCPECGTQIGVSVSQRVPPIWEDYSKPPLARFILTTAQIIFRPSKFYRQMTTRGNAAPALRFARIHWSIIAALLAVTGCLHLLIVNKHTDFPLLLGIGLFFILDVALESISRLAAYLTNWEGTYRGYRLPYPVVLRALYYHAAHLLPVAVVALITVCVFLSIQNLVAFYNYGFMVYLALLGSEVVIGAVYLFITYWIAMKRLMFANQ